MCRKGRDRSLESPPKPLEKQHGGGPEGPGASAVKPAGSGALGSWALGPLQRPQADTGLPSHGVPHEPWGGPWRRGCGCSGRGPVYPSRAGDAVLEDRGAGAPRAPRRLRKSRAGGSNATQSGLDRISAPRRAGDRARAGPHGDTCPWAPGPRGFLTLAGLNAAWNCAKWLRGVGQFFFLDPQNTVTYPTILEGLSQRTFINISAK